MEKLKGQGIPLREFAGVSPTSGVKTGCNEAFLIDAQTKEKLVSDDPNSAALFKKYMRGQDIDRWQAEWNGLWMLALKSSGNHGWPWTEKGENSEAIFAATYPAIYTHLNQYRDALVKRQDQGEYWWELRACAYWAQFEKPKIMYQEIQYHSCYMLDELGMLANNKVFFLPTNDLYVLAILNSPLLCWHNWRYLPHMLEFGIDKPSQKLQGVTSLDADGLAAEVKKVRGRSKPLSVADLKRLKAEHANSVVPIQALAYEARTLESRIADLVNAAYGLTADEIKLMWNTASPRMPIPGPRTDLSEQG